MAARCQKSKGLKVTSRVMQNLTIVGLILALAAQPATTAGLEQADVLKSIKNGQDFLIDSQESNGSWKSNSAAVQNQFPEGVASLAMLALLSSGVEKDHPSIQRGLKYLRSLPASKPEKTYCISLAISALAAANTGQRDKSRIQMWAERLESIQVKEGEDSGGFGYGGPSRRTSDNSNAQYAILGLRDAVYAGANVKRRTWRLAKDYWERKQRSSGGFTYVDRPGDQESGSMTVAGISSLVIVNSMLRDTNDEHPDGTPICCQDNPQDENLRRAVEWLSRRFSVRGNPGDGKQTAYLYYMYGLERAGRLSGTRFFGDHDWYREGAARLVKQQNSGQGSWKMLKGIESDPVVATSFSLLFLAKGLSPVLINKLKYGDEPKVRRAARIPTQNWNLHPKDIHNLTDHISTLPGWPKLMTWQQLDFNKAEQENDIESLVQAPVLFISGRDAPEFTNRQVAMLKEYLDQGGFIFAVANCNSGDFDRGFREFVHKRLFPKGDSVLNRLPPNHPVFRSEENLTEADIELYGAEFGCRTAIIYSPDDLSCLWDKISRKDPPNRSLALKQLVIQKTKIGVNVIAYATDRELPNKLEQAGRYQLDEPKTEIERSLLQVAKLRHGGNWNVSPQALKNLLTAVNRTAGTLASTKQRDLNPSDPNLHSFPLLFMHGRNQFELTGQEQEQIRRHLERGGMLFVDACCAAKKFDRSFREMIEQMFPDKKLQQVPTDHEMYTEQVGHNLSQISRRESIGGNTVGSQKTVVRTGPPVLEGIEIDGRYAVVYSKYDISCALGRQSSTACEGYLEKDAVKLATNIVLYSLLQEVAFQEK